MNELRPLLFEGEQLVRMQLRDDEPWFVAADVCRVLGIKNARDAVEKLDDDEKGVGSADTLGGAQEVLTVSEGGLYTLILRSRAATTPGSVPHRFRRWVTHEVIPSIRKTGSYSAPGAERPALPSEKRPFPEWPMEEMRTKRGIADMYRLLYGPMAAQWIAPQLGFPVPPVELIEHGRQYTMTLTFSEAA